MERELLIAVDLFEPVELQIGDGTLWALTRRRPDGSGPNEDAAGAWWVGGQLVLAVADGFGGASGGAAASAAAIEALDSHLKSADAHRPLRSSIIDAFESANANRFVASRRERYAMLDAYWCRSEPSPARWRTADRRSPALKTPNSLSNSSDKTRHANDHQDGNMIVSATTL